MDAMDFLDIPSIIQAQFDEIAPGRVKVCDEQAFLSVTPEEARERIVAVCRLGSATSNYGQTALPVTVSFMGLQNEIRTTKRIVAEYALRFNLKTPTAKANYLQFYNTPSVVQNFGQSADGYASILSMGGYFLFAGETDYITSITYEGEEGDEEIRFVSAQFSLTMQNNTQPVPDGNGLTRSVTQYGVLSFSFSAYLSRGGLADRLFDFIADPTEGKANGSYAFRIGLLGGRELSLAMKLATFSPSQSIGSLPVYAAAFTL